MHENACITMIKFGISGLYGQKTGVAADFRYENCIGNS
jgi:hypothetical protein